MFERRALDTPIASPGVHHENRDARTHANVVLDFDAWTASQSLKGIWFSSVGFRAQMLAKPDIVNTHSEDVIVGQRREFRLRIHLSGFICEIMAMCECTQRETVGSHEILTFSFIAMDAASRDALQRVIRSYLSGYIASPEDAALSSDPATLSPGAVSSAAAVTPKRSRFGNVVAFTGSLIVLAIVLSLAGISLYEHFYVVRSSFATVTAPRIDILSPTVGQLRIPDVAVGETVSRDEFLYEIRAEELAADIEYAEARVAYYRATAAQVDTTNTTATGLLESEIDETLLATQDMETQSAAGGETIVAGQQPTVQPPASLASFNEEQSLAEGLLRSLRLREANLTSYSPCQCLVAWSQENGAWVKDGDPVMTLARTGVEDLRVEALVQLKFADELHVGQSALVESVETGKTIAATVEQIVLDPTRQPRVGFPEWLRREPTLASVVLITESPLEARFIGTPLKIVLTLPLGMPQVPQPFWEETPMAPASIQ